MSRRRQTKQVAPLFSTQRRRRRQQLMAIKEAGQVRVAARLAPDKPARWSIVRAPKGPPAACRFAGWATPARDS